MTKRFLTKEDYEKDFKSIYYSGYSEGVKDGIVKGLSYIIGQIYKDFSDQQIGEALYESRQRDIKYWQEQEEYFKSRLENELQKRLKESSEVKESS